MKPAILVCRRVFAQTLAGLREHFEVEANDVDMPACTARGVVVTNAPGVRNETTADFALALMMAAARPITESEHFVRRGEWTKWTVDLFAGGDVHGATPTPEALAHRL